MMEKEEIQSHLEALSMKLSMKNVAGEICLYGGAVMCLVYDARPATKDVDAVFTPASEIRNAALLIAEECGLPEDWLNDAVKGFLVPHGRRVFLDLPSLKVYVPEPDYLLAMKALSARVDGADQNDVRFLVREMGLSTPEQVFDIVRKYYAHERIKPATQFFIEEIFQ
jgi:hypothetical protein